VASPELKSIIETMRARPSYKTLSVPQLREGLAKLFGQYPPPPGLTRAPVRAGGVSGDWVPGEWIQAAGSPPDRVIYYLHGGAYIRGSVQTHISLLGGLSRSCAARVFAIDYRLGPEHPFPAAVEDAVAGYRWLLAQAVPPDRIVIGGDSAGGGLALAALLSLRDAGVPLPAGAVLLSPWSDLAVTGESVETRAAADPMLGREYLLDMARMYLGSGDPRNALASPVFADLHGLPPLFIQVGTAEVLYDDATRLVEHALAAEVEVTFEPWPEMIHGWHLFAAILPEARQAIEHIGAFARRILDRAAPVVGAWAGTGSGTDAPRTVTVAESGSGSLGQTIVSGRHVLSADEPLAAGGRDSGPNPYDLLLSALGACTAMTLRLYAGRKQWPLERVSVTLRHQKIHAQDCAGCETKAGKIDRIERDIRMTGPLDAEQRARLLEIANKCPVHRTLHSEVNVVTRSV
jgi:acetyl esterase/lipase/uncharacterized OsmC-like protein